LAQDTFEGRVVQTLGKWHAVWDGGRVRPAFPGGRLALRAEGCKNRVAVGDFVVARSQPQGEALIEEVLPRKNKLSRRITFSGQEHVVAANIDLVAVMLAPNPALNTSLLDRFLTASFAAGIDAAIIANKVDLLDPQEALRALAPYKELHFPIFPMSAKSGEGVEEFRRCLAGRWTLLLGHTGVGKTTLTNLLAPDAQRAIGEVFEKTGKGKHTTTSALAHRLANGGVLIDTAGIREFALWNVTWRQVESAFAEISAAGQGCRFPDCHHRNEPNCKVRPAVDAGTISPGRYASYLTLLQEAE
jgi:ribosome biogenesis GTPase